MNNLRSVTTTPKNVTVFPPYRDLVTSAPDDISLMSQFKPALPTMAQIDRDNWRMDSSLSAPSPASISAKMETKPPCVRRSRALSATVRHANPVIRHTSCATWFLEGYRRVTVSFCLLRSRFECQDSGSDYQKAC
jgi:hypothetical protein